MSRPSSHTTGYLVRRAVPWLLIYGVVLGMPIMVVAAALFG